MRERVGTPAFVLSLGRCGSTLLQRLLNCHPRCFIFGEHDGAFGHLDHFIRSMQRFSEVSSKNADLILNKKQMGQYTAWATPRFDEKCLVNEIGVMIEKFYTRKIPPGGDFAWGFKEIRYRQREIEFLESLFPAGRFIFVTRDFRSYFLSVIRSFLEYKNPNEGDVEKIVREYIDFMEYIKHFKESRLGVTLIVSYQDITSDLIATTDAVFELLGIGPGDASAIWAESKLHLDYVLRDWRLEAELETKKYDLMRVAASLAFRYPAIEAYMSDSHPVPECR